MSFFVLGKTSLLKRNHMAQYTVTKVTPKSSELVILLIVVSVKERGYSQLVLTKIRFMVSATLQSKKYESAPALQHIPCFVLSLTHQVRCNLSTRCMVTKITHKSTECLLISLGVTLKKSG